MENDGYSIIRDSVNGINKYCRIPIRRRRASADESVSFLKQSIADLDDLAKESEGNEEEIHLIRNSQACIFTALDALSTANAVRCANCKYHDGDLTEEGRYFIHCTKLMLVESAELPPDFFCGFGEPEVKDNGKI